MQIWLVSTTRIYFILIISRTLSQVLIVSVERIYIGGGIMQRRGLLQLVQTETMKLLNGYVGHPSVSTSEGMEKYITEPTW